MFDWNEEELTNIIWDEAGESDDHIVPYQEGSEVVRNKKEWSQEAKTIKSAEQKTPGVKIDLHGRKLESTSNYNSNEGISTSGFCVGTCPDLSLSNAAKADQDSMGTEVSNNLAEAKYRSTSGAETAELDKDSEIFQSSHEGKEQGDFVDYSWANIGSFDDLDQIFSNDDPIFAEVSLGSADELWSSSKDVTNSSLKSFPLNVDSPSLGLGALRNTSEHLDTKTENEQQDDHLFTRNYGKVSDASSHGLQNADVTMDHAEYLGGKSKPTMKEQTDWDTGGKTTEAKSSLVEKVGTPDDYVDKACRKKRLLKFRKKLEGRREVRSLQDFYRTWTPSGNPMGQFHNQLAPSNLHSSSLVLSQQRQLQVSETLQYQHISNPFMAASAYGNLTNPYPAMPVLSELNNKLLHSSYEVSPGTAMPVNKSTEATSLAMTPQEKIEKLRRRQQMQAMLAIQRQRQQFGHQVPGTDHSITKKCPLENQIQFVGKVDLEGLSTLPSFDPNSLIEQDDSNTISLAVDDYSAEDSVLYQLQDVVEKLDISIRLRIRDSLFRLAQSAMQRHNASDTSSTNKSSRDEHELVAKKEAKNSNRCVMMSNMETETNPIDRTMAHLLFHRPSELSGTHPETPESLASALPCERKTVGLVNLPLGCKPESFKIKQSFPQQGSKSPCPLAEPQQIDHFNNIPCIDISENASNYGPADVGRS